MQMTRLIFTLLLTLTMFLYLDHTSSYVGAEERELKIAVISPLSGGGMAWGYATLSGLEIAMDDVNKAGGLKVGNTVYTLKAIPRDSKYLADVAITAAKRVIYEDKVKIIFGTIGSAEGLATQGITEPNKILLTPVGVFTHRFLAPDKPYSFRFILTNVEFFPFLLEYYRERWPNAKKIAYLYPNDETGQDAFNWMRKYAGKQNFEVIGFPWERGTPNLSPVVTKALTANVDLMDLGVTPPGDAGQFVNILRDMGWSKQIVKTGGSAAPDLIRLCGKNANGIIYFEDGDFSLPKSAFLAERFKEKKYPGIANTVMVPAYDGAMMLFKSIQKAGTVDDTIRIKEALESIGTYEGLQGPVHWGGKENYGIDHQIYRPLNIGEITDGKPKTVLVKYPK